MDANIALWLRITLKLHKIAFEQCGALQRKDHAATSLLLICVKAFQKAKRTRVGNLLIRVYAF